MSSPRLSLSIHTLFWSIVFFDQPFMQSLSFPEHLKATIFRFFSIISSPVAGFLPFLGAFSLTQNFPNPEIMTSSPDTKVDFIVSRSSSIVSFAFESEILLFYAIFSMIVDFVSAKVYFSLLFRYELNSCTDPVYLLSLSKNCQEYRWKVLFIWFIVFLTKSITVKI